MFLFLKENLFELIFILILLVVLAYVVNISSIPDSIILFEDDDFIYETIAGIQIEEEESNQNEQTISVGADITSENKSTENKEEFVSQTKTYNLSLLGVKVKTVTASVISNRKVIPLGNLAGLKLYTEGVLVVGLDQIEGEDGKLYKPYEELGIEQGDSIIKINNEEVETTEELLECVSKSNGKTMRITYLKDGETVESSITPVKTGKNTYKLGLWVRDAAAGVGTLSFYDPSTNSIASLGIACHEFGHALQDKSNYAPLRIRQILIPITNFMSSLLWPLVILGLIFNFGVTNGGLLGSVFLWSGVAIFGSAVLVNLITLPVEFNASKRAIKLLKETETLQEDELQGAKQVLNAAALTYLAALLVSMLNLLRFLILILSSRSRD